MTSFSMITNHYGFNDNPDVVNRKIGDYACPFSYASAGSVYSLSLVGNVHNNVTESYAKSYILGALRNNKPVMVGLYKGSKTHFVVVNGYLEEAYDPGIGSYGEIYYYIKDPESDIAYDYLDQYFKAGWEVNRLKVYGN